MKSSPCSMMIFHIYEHPLLRPAAVRHSQEAAEAAVLQIHKEVPHLMELRNRRVQRKEKEAEGTEALVHASSRPTVDM